MAILLTIFIVFIYQIVWFKKINDFKLKNIYYFLSFLITIVYILFYNFLIIPITYFHIPYFLIVIIMLNLSIIDCKYYEISAKSYLFVLIPALTIVALQKLMFWQFLLGFIFVFVLFFIIDKLVGIEKIGGADVKLLLILSLTIPYYDIFMFLIFSFVIDTLIFIFKFLYYKVLGKKEKIQIPMIIAINLAWILVNFLPRQ